MGFGKARYAPVNLAPLEITALEAACDGLQLSTTTRYALTTSYLTKVLCTTSEVLRGPLTWEGTNEGGSNGGCFILSGRVTQSGQQKICRRNRPSISAPPRAF